MYLAFAVEESSNTGVGVVAGQNEAWFRLGAGSLANSRVCLLYTSPSPRDGLLSRMPSSA